MSHVGAMTAIDAHRGQHPSAALVLQANVGHDYGIVTIGGRGGGGRGRKIPPPPPTAAKVRQESSGNGIGGQRRRKIGRIVGSTGGRGTGNTEK